MVCFVSSTDSTDNDDHRVLLCLLEDRITTTDCYCYA